MSDPQHGVLLYMQLRLQLRLQLKSLKGAKEESEEQMMITFLSKKTFHEHGQHIKFRIVAVAKSSIGYKLN